MSVLSRINRGIRALLFWTFFAGWVYFAIGAGILLVRMHPDIAETEPVR